MSAGYYISEFFEDSGIGAVASIPLAVAGAGVAVVGAGVVAAGAAVLGTAALGVASVGTAVASAGKIVKESLSSVADIGVGVIDGAKIIIEEKKLEKDLWEKFNSIVINASKEENVQNYSNKIENSFNSIDCIINKEKAQFFISKGKTINDKFEIATKLINIKSFYDSMVKNYTKLNEIADKFGVDNSRIIDSYIELKNTSFSNLDDLDNFVKNLSNDINSLIIASKDIIEKSLENKVFVKEYISLSKPEENILPTIFSEEIALLLNENDNEEIKLLKNKQQTLSFMANVYNTVAIMQDLPGFEKMSNAILKLYSSAISLSEKENMYLDDYEYEMNLKINSLNMLLKSLESESKKLYERKRRYLIILSELNKYCSIIGLPPYKNEFSVNTTDSDIKCLNDNLKKVKEETKTKYIAKYILSELKTKYIKMNYKYIPADQEISTSYTTIHKCYFITPDGKNVLKLNVNEKGQISTKVVGVKLLGLNDDAKSIFEAQSVSCSHTKKAIENLFKELNMKEVSNKFYKPDLKKVESEDFSKILPATVINNIRNARQMREKEELKARRIDNRG